MHRFESATDSEIDAPQAPPPRHGARRGIGLLPSLFTVANVGLGWFAIQQTASAMQSVAPAPFLDTAAKAIGWAILLDGLDGRIARLANAASDFGREFDSLADVISFGVAPGLLAYVWGVRFVDLPLASRGFHYLDHAAQLIAFLFVIAGAARLARFNIAPADAVPSNPGKPDKKYFVGMPIPAAAGLIAAFVHFFSSPNFVFAATNPSWIWAIAWLALVLGISYLMVSTWRFYSFKDIDLRRRHPFEITVALGALMAAVWYFSEVTLLILAVAYLVSAMVWRARHHLRPRSTRRYRPAPPERSSGPSAS
ncbi:MAG TPA: phosphatidylcholine/phosphatidylserine synthase [Terriglobales bacterium]|nr:phosphatidylcholine/phosphatidylserine synthase [Terriglobales bacterium]